MAPDKGIAEGEATGVGLLTCEPHQGRPRVAGTGLSTQRRKLRLRDLRWWSVQRDLVTPHWPPGHTHGNAWAR